MSAIIHKPYLPLLPHSLGNDPLHPVTLKNVNVFLSCPDPSWKSGVPHMNSPGLLTLKPVTALWRALHR